ncbi:MAG: hypothetical protein M3Q71_00415 [Chloroflexota bacterium]|nr:hypothetical protein [Chloroflexota bacterium]
MGHVRLGRLPKSQNWQELVTLLAGMDPDPAHIATATAWGAYRRLGKLRQDPSLTYCFWLLSRLASAARRPDFADALGDLGLQAHTTDSIFGFVAQVGDRVRDEVGRHPESGPFGDLASDALTRALTETVGTEGRSLFGSSVDDLEQALRKHATPGKFGVVAQRFFGDFLARTLRFYVDKELPQHVGTGGFADIGQSAAFVEDLDRYARQSAVIVQQYAADWFSLHDWEARGVIGRDDAQRFVAVALKKLRTELTEPRA